MLRFEKRWAEAVLSGFAPAGNPGLAPAPGEVDYAAAMEHILRVAGPRAGLGFRAALWMAALAPAWSWRRPVTAVALSPGERARLLDELLTHRSFVPRELSLMLKVAASMAMMATPSVRARSGYDAPMVQADDLTRSGERVRLPLAMDEVA